MSKSRSMRHRQHVLHVWAFFPVWNWIAIISFWGGPVPLQGLAPSGSISNFHHADLYENIIHAFTGFAMVCSYLPRDVSFKTTGAKATNDNGGLSLELRSVWPCAGRRQVVKLLFQRRENQGCGVTWPPLYHLHGTPNRHIHGLFWPHPKMQVFGFGRLGASNWPNPPVILWWIIWITWIRSMWSIYNSYHARTVDDITQLSPKISAALRTKRVFWHVFFTSF